MTGHRNKECPGWRHGDEVCGLWASMTCQSCLVTALEEPHNIEAARVIIRQRLVDLRAQWRTRP